MDLQAHMGQKLAELREARGLSQHQLAKAVGVSSQYVGRLESGMRAPSFRLLDALASTLNVDPGDLVTRGPKSRKKAEPLPVEITHLQGAARRLGPEDLALVLDLARRLGRRD